MPDENTEEIAESLEEAVEEAAEEVAEENGEQEEVNQNQTVINTPTPETPQISEQLGRIEGMGNSTIWTNLATSMARLETKLDFLIEDRQKSASKSPIPSKKQTDLPMAEMPPLTEQPENLISENQSESPSNENEDVQEKTSQRRLSILRRKG